MGAADAVPGVSGGTIAFVTGIYEELINTIKQFSPVRWGCGIATAGALYSSI